MDGIRTHDTRLLGDALTEVCSLVPRPIPLFLVRSSGGCSHTNQNKDLNLISSILSVSYTHYSVVVLTKFFYLGQVNKTEQDTLQRNKRRHTKDK